MKRIITPIFAVFLAVASSSAGELKIDWQSPEDYRDADYYYNGSEKSRDIVLTNLEKYFVRTAKSRLPEGTVLEMTVTEVDLAGEFEPWRGPSLNDVRIVKQLYPARIDFDYKYFAEDGTLIAEGSEQLKDLMIPRSLAATTLGRSENYAYVKTLVSDWMRKLSRKGQ